MLVKRLRTVSCNCSYLLFLWGRNLNELNLQILKIVNFLKKYFWRNYIRAVYETFENRRVFRMILSFLEIICMSLFLSIFASYPAGNYMFKVNNRNTRARCEICSELTIKIPERRHWRRSGIFIVDFEHILHLVLRFPLLTLSRWIPARRWRNKNKHM